jgi:hypothetical protein
LPVLGYRITPPKFKAVRIIPRWMQIAALRAFINSPWMDLVSSDMTMAQSRDEMFQLALEFRALVEKSGLPAPAIRKLLGSSPIAEKGLL